MAASTSLHLAAGDDLHQIGIGQKRRIFQDRRGDDGFHIMRQAQRDVVAARSPDA